MDSESKDLRKLLSEMRSDWRPAREAALREAAQLPRARLRALLSIAAEFNQRKRRQMRLVGVLALLINGAGVVAIFIYQPFLVALLGWLFGFLLFDLIAFPIALSIGSQGRSALNTVLDLCMVTRYDVQPLNEALYGEARAVGWEKIRAALQSMLPAVSAEEVNALAPEEHDTLLRLIRHPLDEETALLVLDTVARVKDLSAITAVKQLVEQGGLSGRLQEPAQACLEKLQASLAAQREEQALLRAADSTSAPSDALLRPAQEGPEPPSEELLRIPTQDGGN
ncbi:MAG TPA: hypothetical protein VKT32_02125 [Chthonomonadaceae bacterium]|nr:hypothetical protein [Chthonomonadaceae bacterium]